MDELQLKYEKNEPIKNADRMIYDKRKKLTSFSCGWLEIKNTRRTKSR